MCVSDSVYIQILEVVYGKQKLPCLYYYILEYHHCDYRSRKSNTVKYSHKTRFPMYSVDRRWSPGGRQRQ